VTDDPQIASMCALLREHGQAKKYDHEVEGYTSRLDTLQALFLLRKLPYLEQWNGERRAIANAYRERLDGVGDLVLPPVPPGSEPVWHLFVIRTSSPADLQAFLAGRGIGSGRHYPSPPHLTRAYAWLGLGVGAFPVSESLCREALSLPIFPGMTEVQVEAVVEAVADFFVHR
jgi:dTDP-4-amino-4,6-dideoxygalactose transaminase